ncbi:MAG: hypothetical protein UU47_C0012G0003 [candidate division TM6 bacterium GW2011_GWE2_41_16]|nr:MAG: hypothetical protein UU47_C0012G0003 [candidate division TM6 bacterium GW2011_GWE2_41_16]
MLAIGASTYAMEQMPAMQHAFRHGGQTQVYKGNTKTEVQSKKQQKAAVRTTGFYGMSLKQGAGSALVALTVLMAISAAVQPAEASWGRENDAYRLGMECDAARRREVAASTAWFKPPVYDGRVLGF